MWNAPHTSLNLAEEKGALWWEKAVLTTLVLQQAADVTMFVCLFVSQQSVNM